MGLSKDLVSQFVKATNDNKKEKKDQIVYGTITDYNDKKYVQIDGSEILTPMASTVDLDSAEDGERVSIIIKNHEATIIGNNTSPSARKDIVDGLDDSVELLDSILEMEDSELGMKSSKLEMIDSQLEMLNSALEMEDSELGMKSSRLDMIDSILDMDDSEIGMKSSRLDMVDSRLELFEALLDVEESEVEIGGSEIEIDGTKVYMVSSRLNSINSDVDIINSAFKIENGVVTGLTGIEIDWADIDSINTEQLYANSGLIQYVVSEDQTVTGQLVGVTIHGDLIQGGTVVADKLVIRNSEDGLLYKINVEALGDAAEEYTDEELQNGLHGNVINDKTIVATKLDVSDLVAFRATIGGFIIGRELDLDLDNPDTYIPSAGKSVADVAEMYGITTSELIALNDLVTLTSTSIFNGTTQIKVPKTFDSRYPSCGKSVADVSEMYGITADDLLNLNEDLLVPLTAGYVFDGTVEIKVPSTSGGYSWIYPSSATIEDVAQVRGITVNDLLILNQDNLVPLNSDYIFDGLTEIQVPKEIGNSIHSYLKDSATNLAPGVYLGTTNGGEFAVGNADKYFRYYYDEEEETYRLELQVDEIKFGTNNTSMGDIVNRISGENLISNSLNFADGEDDNSTYVQSEIEDDYIVLTIDPDESYYGRYQNIENIKPETYYTLSFLVKDLTGVLSAAICPYNTFNGWDILGTTQQEYTISEEGRHSFTVKTPANVNSLRIYIFASASNNSQTCTAEISHLMLEEGITATRWTPAPQDPYDLYKKVTTEYIQSEEGFKQTVMANYYTADEVIGRIETHISQNESEIRFDFEKDLNDAKDDIAKYIRFIDGKIYLGEQNNPLELQISNNRMSFLENGTEVAYFSDSKFHITYGEVLTSLKIGNYAFIPRSNGSLDFTKIEGSVEISPTDPDITDDPNGSGDNPSTPGAPTAPSTPTIQSATDTSSGSNYSIFVSWSSVSGASGYSVSYDSGANWTDVGTSTSKSFTGLSPLTSYGVQVKAYKTENGQTSYSNPSSTYVVITAPPTPTGLTATHLNDNGVSATWNSVTGVNGYELEITENGDTSYHELIAPSWTSIADPSTTYIFRVRAYIINSDGDKVYSEWSSSDSTTTDASPDTYTVNPPTNLTVIDITANSFTLNWSKSNNADSYRISINGGPWIDYGDLNSLTLEHLVAATTYSVEVKGYAVYNGTGIYSTGVSTTVTTANSTPVNPSTLSAPTNVEATYYIVLDTSLILVIWDPVTNADGYQVSTDGLNWTNTGFQDNGDPYQSYGYYDISEGQTYTFYVRAYKGSGSSITYSEKSTGASVTIPDEPIDPTELVLDESLSSPTGLTATPDPSDPSHKLNLSWSGTVYTGFVIGYCVFGSDDMEYIVIGSDHTYTLTGLQPSTKYLIVISAYTSDGTWSYGATAFGQTTAGGSTGTVIYDDGIFATGTNESAVPITYTNEGSMGLLTITDTPSYHGRYYYISSIKANTTYKIKIHVNSVSGPCYLAILPGNSLWNMLADSVHKLLVGDNEYTFTTDSTVTGARIYMYADTRGTGASQSTGIIRFSGLQIIEL